MSSQEARVDRLEARTGDKSQPFAVQWPDSDNVVVNGETMTREEFEQRWPGAYVIRVVYESHPAIKGELVGGVEG